MFRGEIDDRRFTIRGKFIYRMLARRVKSFEILFFLSVPCQPFLNGKPTMAVLGPDYMSRAGPVSRVGLSSPGSQHVC